MPAESADRIQDWQGFATGHYEREALHTRDAADALGIDEEAVFDALTRVRVTTQSATVAMRFLSPAARGPDAANDLLPVATDHDFGGYAERIDRALDGAPYTLMVNGLQSFDIDLWRQAAAFATPLYDALGGIPPGFASIVAVFGRYPATPFGIHRDWASTFMFMLSGTKRVWLWQRPADDDGVPTYDDPAQTFDAGPGDMVYWPSSAWHVLSSEPEASLSVHVVLRFSDDVIEEVLEATRRHVAPAPSKVLLPDRRPDGAERLDIRHLPALSAAREAVLEAAHSEDLAQALLERWMTRCSGAGFAAVPPPRPAPEVDGDALLRIVPGSRMVVEPTIAGRLACAANGHLRRLPDVPLLRSALAALAEGAPVAIDRADGARAHGAIVREAAGWLVSVGAIEPVADRRRSAAT